MTHFQSAHKNFFEFPKKNKFSRLVSWVKRPIYLTRVSYKPISYKKSEF